MNSGNLLKHRCPGPFEMACGKWDVHAGLADAAQDLWDTRDLLEDTHPQSHEPRELLENEDDHNSGIHQLHLMRAFLTSRPITASD